MGIRIQPREIEIPKADPFKYDLLDRKEPISVLTHIIGSIDGPCVLAVDAPWGCRQDDLSQYLGTDISATKNSRSSVSMRGRLTFQTIHFIALSDAISQELAQFQDGSFGSRIDDAAKHAIRAMRWVAPVVVKAATGVSIDIPHQPASYAEKRLSGYRDALKALEDFSDKLREVASELAEAKTGLPLVVVIDELDRMPSLLCGRTARGRSTYFPRTTLCLF